MGGGGRDCVTRIRLLTDGSIIIHCVVVLLILLFVCVCVCVQISYSALSPRLSEEQFQWFFRVMAPENQLSKVRIRLLQHFNWTVVTMIQASEHLFSSVSVPFSGTVCKLHCHSHLAAPLPLPLIRSVGLAVCLSVCLSLSLSLCFALF